jgi:hypothetical protein
MYGLSPDIDLSFLAGRQLEQLCLGQYQVQLRFDGDVEISIEGEFTFDGTRREVGEGHVLHVLLGLKIDAVRHEGDGDVALSLGQHALTIHDSKEHYESYQLYAPGRNIIV